MRYMFRRLLTYIVLFAVVLNLDFLLPRLAPGSAADFLCTNSVFPQIRIQDCIKRFGLNQPLYLQYVHFLQGVFTRWPPYFGQSFQFYPADASTIFFQRLPWSMILILSSIFLGFFAAYFLVGYNSLHRGSKREMSTVISSIAIHSTPVFWVGIILLWVFAVTLHWFPLYGTVGNNLSGWAFVKSVIWHAVLPIVTLSASIFGEFYFLLRGSVQQALKDDFVVLARSRGIPDRTIMFRYVLRNSLLPIIALLSFSIASLISRDALVEAVFGYPGLGDLMVDGIISRDYPVLQAALTYSTLIVIAGGLLGDFILLRLDPRLRR
jgi:peptide/nickel transport system permease protein